MNSIPPHNPRAANKASDEFKTTLDLQRNAEIADVAAVREVRHQTS